MKYLSMIIAALLPLTLPAQTKLSDLIEGTTIVATDLIPFVDVSDTTQAASGSTKKAQAGVLASELAQLIAPTWNNGATDFTALKVNVTNTASGAGSKLLDLQVGGVSKLYINPSGGMVMAPSGTSVALSAAQDGNKGFLILSRNDAAGNIFVTRGDSTHLFSADIATFAVSGALAIGGDLTSVDVFLRRQAANTLAQRNGTNAQEFRLYNTYDGTNDEWGYLKWDTNVLKLGTYASGTGTGRNIRIDGAGGSVVISTGGLDRWQVGPANNFYPSSDNSYTLGTSAARVKEFYLAEFQEMSEMTAPSAPSANKVRIYAEDNGAGKTRLMALFPSGAAQQIAIEP